jgi:hypothetical protein
MSLGFVSAFRKGVKPALMVAMIAAIISYILGSTLLLKFKSEALLSVELSVSEYKRITESLGAAGDIAARLAAQPGQADDADIIKKMLVDGAAKWHTPIARVSKAEAKDLPDAVLKLEFDKASDSQRPYSGVRLTANAGDAQQAARVVGWLGDYYRDSAAKELLRQEIFGWKADNQSFKTRAQEEKIRVAYEVEQSQARADSLKKVLAQYPDLAKIDSRSVVDVRKENEKFMSPGGQLIAAEVEIINLKESLSRLERQITQVDFIAPFLEASEKALANSKSGQELITRLSESTTFYSKRIENEAQREVLLAKAARISDVAARFYSRAQFVVPPSIPDRAEAPRPNLLAALGGLLFGLLALLWTIRDWIYMTLKDQAVEASTDS